MNLGPQFQGSMDGLCGMYAITNAISVACGIGRTEDVFKYACKGLAHSRWPSVLWDGTSFADMQRMIKNCLISLEVSQIQVRYPFLQSVPDTNKEYWDRFDLLYDDNVCCAVLGGLLPEPHWIVARRESGKMMFLDSAPGPDQYKKRDRSSLFAGERRQKKSQWLLNRKQVILFSTVG